MLFNRPIRHRRTLAVVALLGTALVLGACATLNGSTPIADYVAPRSGPTARLAIRGFVMPGERYAVFLLRDATQCRQPVRIGIQDHESVSIPTTTLEAGQLTTLDFAVRRQDSKVCVVRWSFTPLPNRTYAFWGQSRPGKDCMGTTALLSDTSDPNEMPEMSARRRMNESSDCLPLEQSPTVASLIEKADRGRGSKTSGNDAVLNHEARNDDLKGLMR